MKFDATSFVLGAAVSAALMGRRVRPLLLELATAGYRMADTLMARLVIRREDLEDLLAEARVRARSHQGARRGAR